MNSNFRFLVGSNKTYGTRVLISETKAQSQSHSPSNAPRQRKLSGTSGSNPLSSSKESAANCIAREGRSAKGLQPTFCR
jgi:hypothetical protein